MTKRLNKWSSYYIEVTIENDLNQFQARNKQQAQTGIKTLDLKFVKLEQLDIL